MVNILFVANYSAVKKIYRYCKQSIPCTQTSTMSIHVSTTLLSEMAFGPRKNEKLNNVINTTSLKPIRRLKKTESFV